MVETRFLRLNLGRPNSTGCCVGFRYLNPTYNIMNFLVCLGLETGFLTKILILTVK